MTTEVFFSYLPRAPRDAPRNAQESPLRRGLILLEVHAGEEARLAVMDIPPEVLANLASAGRLAGHGLLEEILRRLTRPRPVVWGGRTAR